MDREGLARNHEACLMDAARAVIGHDAVRVSEEEWDRTPERLRVPYREFARKNGWVYAVRVLEDE